MSSPESPAERELKNEGFASQIQPTRERTRFHVSHHHQPIVLFQFIDRVMMPPS
jgi:hypothetical protein